MLPNSMPSFPGSAWERTTTRLCLAASLLALLAVPARAENVDLSTVPSRSSVQLTIYNSEDITLVRETRAGDVQKRRQSPPVLLGEHADRSVERSNSSS